MKRFADVNDDDIRKLREDKYSKKTAYLDSHAKGIFLEFIEKEGCHKEDIATKEEMDGHLKKFYASVRKQDGTYFALGSFKSLRFGIARVLKSMWDFDILNDPAFNNSNATYEDVKVFLKKNGKAGIRHTISIMGGNVDK
jgi:hypothetical protein